MGAILVSVLFNEPKLLKLRVGVGVRVSGVGFSALQRAEIAEISEHLCCYRVTFTGFSALQRAEIAEIVTFSFLDTPWKSFSALQRAEIAEIPLTRSRHTGWSVSVLFNEPKLLKSGMGRLFAHVSLCFSALQRAEIAEICPRPTGQVGDEMVSVLFNEPKLLKSRPSLPALPVSQILIPARRRS